jgi:hypothetical protein
MANQEDDVADIRDPVRALRSRQSADFDAAPTWA